ncbi:rhomboid family intramembrane serine protease [Oceanobacillus manasiensis]|uniref:rhomboid family intramembrane serine protease n=1 Tax=Oceanobacillus manasiensis TaxID=586413 RepID=UPI0005A6781B|nr:rhomboid family intramembrane serine protease [Oceanobacillus manasiensis]
MFIRNERSITEFIKFYPVVSTIIIIHIILWLIHDFLSLPIGDTLYQLGAGSNYHIAQGEYWRFITPMFFHAGLMHMLFNSFSLVLFGPALEQMLGKVKFIIAYVGAGVVANIASFILGHAFYMHVGASGAVFGLFGIYIFMKAFRKHLIDYQSSQMITVILVIGLIMTFLRPNINVYAHIFGFIGGFVIAPLVLRQTSPYSPWQRRYRDDDEVQFDPNRWKKKRVPSNVKKNAIWIIIGLLALIGLLSRIL